MTNDLLEGLLSKDRRALAKAITLIEDVRATSQEKAHTLLKDCMKHERTAIRIGISGPPGVGKSTFIETLGLELIAMGKSLAVLAIDPSSPISGGSLLGDKTRMPRLSANANAFIRPAPSGGKSGGIARKTEEAAVLCEAYGVDFIIIETVGVGQTEYEVSSLVDHFVLLELPNSGDEIQGVKRGILELANIFCINKSDGENLAAAKRSKAYLTAGIGLLGTEERPYPPQVFLTSGKEGSGVPELISFIYSKHQELTESKKIQKRRTEQRLKWFERMVLDYIHTRVTEKFMMEGLYLKTKKLVRENSLDPQSAFAQIIKNLKI